MKRGYIAMTLRQSMELRHKGSWRPHPKKCTVLLISARATEGHFEGKMPRHRKDTNGVLFLHNAPAHWAVKTHKKLASLGIQCLDHPPYSPDMAPSKYHLFPGLKKLKGCNFYPTCRSSLLLRPGWMDNILIFFFF
jgi:hypothetical protein